VHKLPIWFLSTFDWIFELRTMLQHYIFSSHGSNRFVRMHLFSHLDSHTSADASADAPAYKRADTTTL